jgi:integrase
VNRDHTALIALLNKLDRWQAEGFIEEHVKLPKRNPAKYIAKAGESESKIKSPTLEQFQALLINASDNAMRRIILGAGLMMRRKKELLEMRKSTHVDVINGVIKGLVSKRKPQDEDRQYSVVITPTVQMLIDTAQGDHLFNFANFPKRWERTLRRAGLRKKAGVRLVNGRNIQDWVNLVQFRALRKIGGTLLNLENTDPRTIQEMYRHSSLDMTQRYVSVVPKAVIAAAGRLDEKLAWRKKVDDSVDYTPRFKSPKYLNRFKNRHVPGTGSDLGATPS